MAGKLLLGLEEGECKGMQMVNQRRDEKKEPQIRYTPALKNGVLLGKCKNLRTRDLLSACWSVFCTVCSITEFLLQMI